MSTLIIAVRNDVDQEYLRDESRSVGAAESISFPRDEQELHQVVRSVAAAGKGITIQGARTGLAAAAVPHGGHVLNLSRMNRIKGLRYGDETGTFYVSVEPGVLLTDLRKTLNNLSFDTAGWSADSKHALEQLQAAGPYHFTPDPTETSASIGGMVNCNASGARSFFYGATRGYVQALRIVLADGSVLCLRRGEHRVADNRFTVTTADGRQLCGYLPDYPMPQGKNAAGYYLKPDMDLVDLFIGSEGTLGVVSEVELQLLPLPEAIWGVSSFFPDESSALRFVQAVRGERLELGELFATRPVAIEYFNHRALDLLRRQRAINAAFSQMQPLASHYHTAIYVEFHGQSDEELQQVILELGRLIDACGGDEADSWVASAQTELEQLQFFRHATPECVNLVIDQRRRTNPALTKLGTDMAVPDEKLTEVVELYNRRIADLGLETVAFGHIGDNHIHVNILPRNLDDYLQGKQLYLEWARQAIAWGGTVSAEHGIGKLKTAFLAEMYGQEGLSKMRQVKRLFDPTGLFNPGNMFDGEGEVGSR